MAEEPVLALCDRIRAISLALHGFLRHGHLEKVYENGLAHRLRKEGIGVAQQYPLKVLVANASFGLTPWHGLW
jgi:GxxExxY protein